MKKYLMITSVVMLLLSAFLCLQCSKNETGDGNVLWNTSFSDDFHRTGSSSLGSNYSVQVGGVGANGTASVVDDKLSFGGKGFWAIRCASTVSGDKVRASVTCKVTNGRPQFGIVVKSRDLGSDWMSQEFYGVFADSSGFAIYKCEGATPYSTPYELISKTFNIQNNRVYKLQIAANNKKINAFIEDIVAGTKDSLQFTDSGTMPVGNIVSLNGNNNSSTDSLLFDDFIIEKGE